jgi:hypothetical protein
LSTTRCDDWGLGRDRELKGFESYFGG